MKFLVLSGLAFGQCAGILHSPEALTTQWKLSENMLAGEVARLGLRSELVSQQSLAPHELIVPGYGVCAAACISAIVYAESRGHESPLDHAEIIARTVQFLNWRMNRDARLGTTVLYAGEYFESLIDRGELTKSLSPQPLSDIRSEQDLTLPVGAVLLIDVKTDNEKLGHAILVLGVDRQARKILAYDPNYTGELHEIEFAASETGVDLLNFYGLKRARVDQGVRVRRVPPDDYMSSTLIDRIRGR